MSPLRAFGNRRAASLAVVVSLSCLFLSASPSRTVGDADSITVGAIKLSLGMNEADVTKQLSAEFELEDHWKAGSSSVWKVCERGVTKHNCPATVSFEGGELFEAAAQWRQDGTTADFARFLNTIVSRFVADGHASCRLDTVKLRDQFFH